MMGILCWALFLSVVSLVLSRNRQKKKINRRCAKHAAQEAKKGKLILISQSECITCKIERKK